MPRYQFSCFEFETETLSLTKQGQPLHLRAKTAKLLKLFLENANVPLSKELLMEQVWDYPFVSTEVLCQTIFDLRKALGSEPRQPKYVYSIKGFGYEWRGDPTCADSSEPPDPPPEPVPADPEIPARLFDRLFWLPSLAGLLLLVLISLLVVATFGRHRLPILTQDTLISLGPFENKTGEPEYNWLEYCLPDMMSHTFMDYGYPTALLNSPEVLPGLDQTEKTRWVLGGSLSKSDKSYQFHYTLTSDKLTWTGDFEAGKALETLSPFQHLVLSLLGDPNPASEDFLVLGKDQVVREAFFAGLQSRNQKHYLDASTHFAQVLQLDPSLAWARIYLAEMALHLEQVDRAERLVQQSMDQALLAQSHSRVIYCYDLRAKLAELQQDWPRVLQQKLNRESLIQASKLRSSFEDQLDLARAYVKNQRYQEASSLYLTLESLAGPRSQKALIQQKLGELDLARSAWSEAELHFRKALAGLEDKQLAATSDGLKGLLIALTHQQEEHQTLANQLFDLQSRLPLEQRIETQLDVAHHYNLVHNYPEAQRFLAGAEKFVHESPIRAHHRRLHEEFAIYYLATDQQAQWKHHRELMANWH